MSSSSFELLDDGVHDNDNDRNTIVNNNVELYTRLDVPARKQQKKTCYICYQLATEHDPLITSPCGTCKLDVHKHCFEELQLYEHTNHRCVIMDIGKSNGSEMHDHYIFYTTCSVCKHRFEYTSPTLMNMFADSLLNRNDVDAVDQSSLLHGAETDENSIDDTILIHQWCKMISTILSYIPEPSRSHVFVIVQKTLEAMANTTSLDTYIYWLRHALCVGSLSIYFTSLAFGFTGAYCIKQWVIKSMFQKGYE